VRRPALGDDHVMDGSRLRVAAFVALVVLALDCISKAAVTILWPQRVVAHLTSPNLVVLPVLVVGALVLVRLIDHPLMAAALGVCAGGVGGNVIERALGLPVTDFLPLPQLPWTPAGVWNLADLAIWVAVPLMVLA